MSTIQAHLYDQFRLPRGPLGRVAGWIMSSRPSNVDRSRWTIELLQLTPDARVLEVGYGPGLGIQAALYAAPQGEVVGLDHSTAMQIAATKRNPDAVRSGRARLLVADAQDPPPGLGTFDAIFSCNVWLFWPDPITTLRGLAALLAPTGRLAVTHLPRHAAAGRADTKHAADRIETQMHEAGLAHTHRSCLDLRPAPAVCVIGTPQQTPPPHIPISPSTPPDIGW